MTRFLTPAGAAALAAASIALLALGRHLHSTPRGSAMPETTANLPEAAREADSRILFAASSDSDDWDDTTWGAWFRTAERAHGDGRDRRPLFRRVGELMSKVTELEARLEKYVGKEPTVADEMAYLRRRLNAVYDVCDHAEKQATRWEHPLPVPEWVATVREAANGERPENPGDRRRRIYLDGKGQVWIDQSVDSGGTQWIGLIDNRALEATTEAIQAETGGLHEIGRCS